MGSVSTILSHKKLLSPALNKPSHISGKNNRNFLKLLMPSKKNSWIVSKMILSISSNRLKKLRKLWLMVLSKNYTALTNTKPCMLMINPSKSSSKNYINSNWSQKTSIKLSLTMLSHSNPSLLTSNMIHPSRNQKLAKNGERNQLTEHR